MILSRTWLERQWLLPCTCAGTNSVLNVYTIRFIKYRFLKSMFRLRDKYTNNRLQRFLVPSVQSCFMPRLLRHMILRRIQVDREMRIVVALVLTVARWRFLADFQTFLRRGFNVYLLFVFLELDQKGGCRYSDPGMLWNGPADTVHASS
jgi:hypothetical protein